MSGPGPNDPDESTGSDRRPDAPGERASDPAEPRLLGRSGDGSYVYYDEGDRTMFEGPAPDEREAGDRVNDQPVGTRGVDGILDAINDREGWDWLSEFAKEHVPGAGNADDASESH